MNKMRECTLDADCEGWFDEPSVPEETAEDDAVSKICQLSVNSAKLISRRSEESKECSSASSFHRDRFCDEKPGVSGMCTRSSLVYTAPKIESSLDDLPEIQNSQLSHFISDFKLDAMADTTKAPLSSALEMKDSQEVHSGQLSSVAAVKPNPFGRPVMDSLKYLLNRKLDDMEEISMPVADFKAIRTKSYESMHRHSILTTTPTTMVSQPHISRRSFVKKVSFSENIVCITYKPKGNRAARQP